MYLINIKDMNTLCTTNYTDYLKETFNKYNEYIGEKGRIIFLLNYNE